MSRSLEIEMHDGDDEKQGLTRRTAVAAGLAGAATLAGLAAATTGGEPRAGEARSGAHLSDGDREALRMPVAFVPHGGGPWPFVKTGIGKEAELASLATYLRSIAGLPEQPPRALLVVSAHWEEAVFTVMSAPQPPMLYDYQGFPPESYQLTWPAPGDPALAARVRQLLEGAGFASGEDGARGFDHGTFVPLKLAYPRAEVPTVQLSLMRGLDPAQHLAVGRALSPLRREGVFIVGSGMTFHNLRAFGARSRPVAQAFDAWLREATTRAPSERDRRLVAWATAPGARQAHPREEHLIPLLVCAGAAGADRGRVAFEGTIVELPISAYHFG